VKLAGHRWLLRFGNGYRAVTVMTGVRTPPQPLENPSAREHPPARPEREIRLDRPAWNRAADHLAVTPDMATPATTGSGGSEAGWESVAAGPDDRVDPTAAMVLGERVA